MHNYREFDYIIVGQGLAGSALSYQLLKAGKRVMVIDEDSKHTSSKVAGGLYNPITGRKMVKTWNADLLFPYLDSFYRELEEVCKARFLCDVPIYRPFISMEEQNEWMGKSSQEEYVPFIRKVHSKPLYSEVNDKYGGIELNLSGYLDVPVYLQAYRAYLKENEAICNAAFNPDHLLVEGKSVIYNEYRARYIIFCEGVKARENVYFKWLPFHPVKGEVLKITSDLALNNILNRGVFVVPLGNSLFRVGSNYDNRDLTIEPTTKAREEIEGKLRDLITFEYDLAEHVAGIRPATRDRRPLIGLHPKYETIGVFNGLGTKGVSLAPYYAGHFVRHLEYGEDLEKEININRYFSLYYDSLNN